MITKTVLIIGNGFDIAHDLPTKYTDFLDFISDNYKTSRAYKKISKTSSISVEDIRNTIIDTLGKDNQLLGFIQNQYLKKLIAGDNWVDFEQEISKVVKYAELKYYSKNGIVDSLVEGDFEAFPLTFDGDNKTNEKMLLHDSFYRLLCAFEIYVTEIINRINCECFSEEIRNLKPDTIISLN